MKRFISISIGSRGRLSGKQRRLDGGDLGRGRTRSGNEVEKEGEEATSLVYICVYTVFTIP